jgi:RNA polymerase sigma factor (sigma-70 family)
MIDGPLLGTAIQQALRSLSGERHGGLTDGQLLARFAETRDEAAFEALLWRHGPMVLGTCRRLLRHPQDAEDAFQATFLVLCRAAHSVRKQQALGGWLYKVAYRICLKARANRARAATLPDHSPEQPVPDPQDEVLRRDLPPALDEELDRLPEKYRAPLVLHYLEGKTVAQVAAELGWRPGTVSGRLARARVLLRARLLRRGVTLASVLSPAAAVVLPVGLVQAAVAGSSRANLAGAAISTTAVTLAEGALRAMMLARLKTAALLLVAVVLLFLGVGIAARPAPAEKPAAEGPPAAPPGAAPGPQAGVDHFGDPLPDGALARLGTLRLRMLPSSIDAVAALSPDCRTLAWVGMDARLHVWDAAAGKELYQIPYPETPVPFGNYSCDGVAFSPDGKILAAGGKRLCLWDGATGKELYRSEDFKVGCGFVTFSPDGKTLALLDHGTDQLRLWDVPGRKELRPLGGGPVIIRALAFSPDGKTLAAGGVQKGVRLWETATGKEVARIKERGGGFHSLAFSPDGKTLAAGMYDRTAHFWELESLPARQEGRTLSGVSGGVSFSPDGKTLAWSGWEEPSVVHLAEATTGKETGRLRARGIPSLIRFLPDGKSLAVVGRGEIQSWDIAARKETSRFSFPGHPFEVALLAFSPDGRTLVSASQHEDGAYVWDVIAGKLRGRFDPGAGHITALGFSREGTPLAVGHQEDGLRLWDLGTNRQVRRLAVSDQTTTMSAAFSAGGTVLAFQKSGQSIARGEALPIHLCDPATGKELRSFGGDKNLPPGILALSPDGKTLAAATLWSPAIAVYDVATEKQLHRFKGPPVEAVGLGYRGLAFSSDGKLLASRCETDGILRVWELVAGKEVLTIHTGAITSLCFSPDNRTLAVAEGKEVRLWELLTGTERHRFRGHERLVQAVAYSPDGKTLASGSEDTTILIWDVTGQALGKGRPVGFMPGEGDILWDDLAAEAPKAYRAMRRLLGAPPAETVLLLKDRLRAGTAEARIARLLADLDADEFIIREKATTELAKLGKVAEPQLREVLLVRPSPEVRRRVERLLEQLAGVNGATMSVQQRTALRALEVLEHIGTPDARQVLEKAARGAPGDRLTQEAKRAVERLAGRALAP